MEDDMIVEMMARLSLSKSFCHPEPNILDLIPNEILEVIATKTSATTVFRLMSVNRMLNTKYMKAIGESLIKERIQMIINKMVSVVQNLDNFFDDPIISREFVKDYLKELLQHYAKNRKRLLCYNLILMHLCAKLNCTLVQAMRVVYAIADENNNDEQTNLIEQQFPTAYDTVKAYCLGAKTQYTLHTMNSEIEIRMDLERNTVGKTPNLKMTTQYVEPHENPRLIGDAWNRVKYSEWLVNHLSVLLEKHIPTATFVDNKITFDVSDDAVVGLVEMITMDYNNSAFMKEMPRVKLIFNVSDANGRHDIGCCMYKNDILKKVKSKYILMCLGKYHKFIKLMM